METEGKGAVLVWPGKAVAFGQPLVTCTFRIPGRFWLWLIPVALLSFPLLKLQQESYCPDIYIYNLIRLLGNTVG